MSRLRASHPESLVLFMSGYSDPRARARRSRRCAQLVGAMFGRGALPSIAFGNVAIRRAAEDRPSNALCPIVAANTYATVEMTDADQELLSGGLNGHKGRDGAVKGGAREAAAALSKEVWRQLGGAQPSFAIVFASTAQPLGELLPPLHAQLGDTTLIGASTAGEFTELGDAKRSAAIFAVAGDYRAFAGLGTGLKGDVEGAVRSAAQHLPATAAGYPHRTAVLLVDPLSGMGEEATLIAAGALGGEVRLAGGAAGDDLQMKSTLVGCGGLAATDALVLAVIFSKRPLGVGVHHGHRPLSSGLKVTRAEGSTIFEIDGRPAWDVWAEQTRASAALRGVDPNTLEGEALFSFLLRYEAGLATGDSFKIRAPLSRGADGSLSFACGIPEGAVIRITESEPDRQIDSAREAARRARSQMEGSSAAGAIVFDWICRNLILGDRFGQAVKAISSELGDIPLAGFETYGEIALDAGDMSGFHNTTTVVLSFPR